MKLLLGGYLGGWKVKNSTSGPQPYQPYEAEITNSPISNNENIAERDLKGGNVRIWHEMFQSGLQSELQSGI